MHFQEGLHHTYTPQSKTKIRGIILLTDNRDKSTCEIPNNMDFRCSAFKETEVDPLDLPRNEFNQKQDEDLIAELNRRVFDLEERVKTLTNSYKMNENHRQKEDHAKRRIRRKFKELVRNRMCGICKKIYGSQTSLKHHIKLKHWETNIVQQ